MELPPEVQDLLVAYFESVEAGCPRSPYDLCRDRPELLPALQAGINAVRRTQSLLGLLPQPAMPFMPRPGPSIPGAHSVNEVGRGPFLWPQIPGYDVVGFLGRGGMGAVYRAKQLNLNRFVALKTLLVSGSATPHRVARFRREAEAIARLHHPHIVQMYEINEHEGCPYFSMELLDGGSLDQRLAAGLPSPIEGAHVVATLALTIAYAHSLGIVHRDLKPGNILLTGDGTPKISDFGLAKQLEAGHRHTRSGTVLGSVSYMAPEQAAGRTQEIGPPADVYGLGAILYETLTGQPPFRGETPEQTLYQVCNTEPVAPRRRQPRVPAELEVICLKCLCKSPADRYRSALDLAEDLRRFLAGEPILAKPPGPFGRLWKWGKRHPTTAALLSVAAVAVLVAVAGITWALVTSSRNAELQAARDAEAAQRARAEQALADKEQALYIARVTRAQLEWLTNDARRTEELLDACPVQQRGWEWHYLQRLAHAEVFTLRGHQGAASAAVFSPDGRLIASGGTDQTVRLWDAQSGRDLWRLAGPHAAVADLAVSRDGRLASAYGDGTIRIWDLARGRDLLTIPTQTIEVTRVAFSPDGTRLASADGDRLIHVWDSRTGQLLVRFRGHTDRIGVLDFSPDGQHLFSAGRDKLIREWDAMTGQPRSGFHPSQRLTRAGAFTRDGKRVAGANGARIILYNSATGRAVRTLQTGQGSVNGLSFSPNGRLLATAGEDRTVKVWQADSFRGLRTFRGHHAAVQRVAFSPDSTRLASAGDDGMVKVWDISRPPAYAPLGEHPDHVDSVAFSPDGTLLATSSKDGTVIVWEMRTRRPLYRLSVPLTDLSCVAFSPDGRLLATGGVPDAVRQWDARSGQQLTVIRSAARTRGVSFSPDGRFLAVVGASGLLQVIDPLTGAEAFRQSAHAGGAWAVAFNPDGTQLATAGADRTTRLWETGTWRERLTLRGHSAEVLGVAFSLDGRLLATASRDGTARVWDLDTGREQFVVRHGAGVRCVMFTRDGTRLVSGSSDNTIKLWDTRTGAEVFTLRGHHNDVSSLAFSPDGTLLASGGDDRTVRLWNARPLVQMP